MWSDFSFYGGYDCYDDGSVNRRGWSDKSDAALTRENEAKKLVEQFLIRAKDSASKGLVTFPLTEEIVCPSIHLTSKSWPDFRKFVVDKKGCNAKRRKVTEAEKKLLPKSKYRKCAMYTISVTIPVHPDELIRAKEEKKAKAAAAKAKKEEKAKEMREKAKRDTEKQGREAAEMKVLVESDYAKVVAFVDGKQDKGKELDEESSPRDQNVPTNNNTKKRAFGDEISVEVNQNRPDGSAKQPSPKKKAKVANANENIVKLVAPQSGLIYEADRVYRAKLNQIAFEMHAEEIKEKRLVLDELSKKMTAKTDQAKKEAAEYCDTIKKAIEGLMSTPPVTKDIAISAKQKPGAITENVTSAVPSKLRNLRQAVSQIQAQSLPSKQKPGAITENVVSTVQLVQNSTVQLVQLATPAAPSDQTKEVATTSKPNPGPVTTNVAIPAVNLAQ